MDTKILTLPLMMYGRDGTQWHTEGEPVKERYITDHTVYKTGKKAGKEKPIYGWRIKTVKRKVQVGTNGVFKSGKRKGEPKPVYETKNVPVPSTGFYPSVNHIYVQIRGGGSRRLKQIAEDKLIEWKETAKKWKVATNWKTQDEPMKVAVDMIFYLPKGQKDTHNAKKLLLDALEGVIHNNDYYICDRTIDFFIDESNPRIEMDIYPLRDLDKG